MWTHAQHTHRTAHALHMLRLAGLCLAARVAAAADESARLEDPFKLARIPDRAWRNHHQQQLTVMALTGWLSIPSTAGARTTAISPVAENPIAPRREVGGKKNCGTTSASCASVVVVLEHACLSVPKLLRRGRRSDMRQW